MSNDALRDKLCDLKIRIQEKEAEARHYQKLSWQPGDTHRYREAFNDCLKELGRLNEERVKIEKALDS